MCYKSKLGLILNVLFVAEYYFANPDLVRLSVELARRGHRISVATSLRNVDRFKAEKGVRIFEIKPFVTVYSIPHSLSFPLSPIHRIVREQSIDIIHALMDYSTNTAFGALISKIDGVPFVYTVQGMGTRTNKFIVDTLAEIYDWSIERIISKAAKKVILLSKSLLPRAIKVGVKNSNIAIVPSGVDYNHFDPERSDVKQKATILRQKLGVSDDWIVVGFVGRLVTAKGLFYLISALRHVEKKDANIVLLLVGDGPQRTYLEGMAKELGIRAIFAGWQMDTAPYYALMDIFVLPSFFEGLPCVVLEAMAMQRPVIATSVGGNPDLITSGENGFLVQAGDYKDMCHALSTLIGNRDLRARMGIINRRKVKNSFSWKTIVRQVETIYNQIV